MGPFRCPYLVRHGQFEKESKSIVFENQCALKLKVSAAQSHKPKGKNPPYLNKSNPTFSCNKFPLKKEKDYINCQCYQTSLLSSEDKRDVIPTKSMDFNGDIESSSIFDLENF